MISAKLANWKEHAMTANLVTLGQMTANATKTQGV